MVEQILAGLRAVADRTTAENWTDEAARLRYCNDALSVAGYSDEEIGAAEAELRCRFPISYRTFLQHFGKNCSVLFDGSTLASIDDYSSLRDIAHGLLSDINQSELLPDHAVVFLHHQGYDFAFFVPSPGVDDPPVFWCDEGGDKRLAASSITEFLLDYANHLIGTESNRE